MCNCYLLNISNEMYQQDASNLKIAMFDTYYSN